MTKVLSLKEQICQVLQEAHGLTDREISNKLFGVSSPQQAVNQAARALATSGRLVRRDRPDGRIGNYINDSFLQPVRLQAPSTAQQAWQSEDSVKRALQQWLETAGWHVEVRWGRDCGIDMEARRDSDRWRIEVKGGGSLNPMRVNYFLCVLGELLQRMNDPATRYSIALPDLPQFRGLWSRLPAVAKTRTQITALFVSDSGVVDEVS